MRLGIPYQELFSQPWAGTGEKPYCRGKKGARLDSNEAIWNGQKESPRASDPTLVSERPDGRIPEMLLGFAGLPM